jgi:hypothetical protein
MIVSLQTQGSPCQDIANHDGHLHNIHHEAVGAGQKRHPATAMSLRALKAEPAHVVGNERIRHIDISPATLHMAVKLATLRQKGRQPCKQ